MTKQLEAKLKRARAYCNIMHKQHGFKSAEYEESFAIVKSLCQMIDDASPAEEFCSVDSGVHRTRLTSGKIV